MSGEVRIRPAERTDVALLFSLIVELADYERAAADWSALHWNIPALAFYEKLGATRLDEWQGFRLAGLDLVRLARRSDDDQ